MWYYTQPSNAVVYSDQYYSSRYWEHLMRFDPARSLRGFVNTCPIVRFQFFSS